jgi:hypothetical protein
MYSGHLGFPTPLQQTDGGKPLHELLFQLHITNLHIDLPWACTPCLVLWLQSLARYSGTVSCVRLLNNRDMVIGIAYEPLDLDSYEYPVRTYADLAFRIFGKWAGYIVQFFQAIQLLLNVSVILISNGESLSQASKFRLCYAVCVVVWAIAGFLFGQVRTLQNFGFLANFAIWINLLIMFITMGVAANSPPLYSAYTASAGYSVNPALATPNAEGNFPPITHSSGLPDASNFGASVNGLMTAVYAYSGTQIFLDFMSEMSQPRNFLRCMWGSQSFIYFCYMLYGLFMYGYQGQFVQNPSYLGISPYNWSTVGNSLAMITAMIAAALYGNLGLKGKLMNP